MGRTNVYEAVTNQIIQQLENGVPPWRRPWASVGGGMPTMSSASGITVARTFFSCRRSRKSRDTIPISGARSANGRSWAVMCGKARRATKIVFWNIVTETGTDPQTGQDVEERRFFAKQFSVFNLVQCGGDALDRFRQPLPVREFVDFGPAQRSDRFDGC